MNDLLNIQNLSKKYENFTLDEISIRVPAGSVVGLIGSNGAGKTTTIKAALGIIKADGGTIDALGFSLDSANEKQGSALKQQIGLVLDAVSFPQTISVEEAGFIMKHAYGNWNQNIFEQYLVIFRLEKKKKIKELSRGMGMKLSLACALSHQANLLILDEATAGLDPLARDEALDILRSFMADESHGILMSSHITSDLEKIADYIVCIDEGRIVFSVEKDAITDLAGVAHCRNAEFERIAASGFFEPGEMRYLKHTYGLSVLVPDRFAFLENFNDIALERATIDLYMGLLLKGATR